MLNSKQISYDDALFCWLDFLAKETRFGKVFQYINS